MHRKQNITPIERPTKIIGYLYYLWYTYHLCTFKVICKTNLYIKDKKKKKTKQNSPSGKYYPFSYFGKDAS